MITTLTLEERWDGVRRTDIQTDRLTDRYTYTRPLLYAYRYRCVATQQLEILVANKVTFDVAYTCVELRNRWCELAAA